jgi:hypothetical protein
LVDATHSDDSHSKWAARCSLQINVAEYYQNGACTDVTTQLQQTVCERFKGSLPIVIADSKTRMWLDDIGTGEPLSHGFTGVIIDWSFNGNDHHDTFDEMAPIVLSHWPLASLDAGTTAQSAMPARQSRSLDAA